MKKMQITIGILGDHRGAFLYGILHAPGPGYRKTVIFSLYLARKAPAWEPAGTGSLLAVLYAGTAIVLLIAVALYLVGRQSGIFCAVPATGKAMR
jgi:ABC-type nickel/cobalt efflux system permease component RcnA